MAIQYLNLPLKLSQEDLQKYNDKLRIYKNFYRTVTIIGNRVVYDYAFDKFKIMTVDEYNELVSKENKPDKAVKILGNKNKNLNDGYLYGMEEKKEDDCDEVDKKFVDDKLNNIKKLVLYGLHTTGPYYGFFRPDLTEVIHMLSTELSVKDLDQIDRIYVTTEAHPDLKFSNCYDYKTNKHKGQTTFYILYKNKRKLDNSDVVCDKKPKTEKD